VFDCDGTLTDGKYYVDEDGKMRKTFHANDVVAIRLFQKAGYKCFMITSATKEDSIKINKQWAEKLGVAFIRARPFKKVEALEKAGIDLMASVFVGDCVDDVFVALKTLYSFCPSNSIKFVRDNFGFTLTKRSGDGVLLEVLSLMTDLKVDFKI